MSGTEQPTTPAAPTTLEEAVRTQRMERLEQRLATIETELFERVTAELAAIAFHLHAAQKRVEAWQERMQTPSVPQAAEVRP